MNVIDVFQSKTNKLATKYMVPKVEIVSNTFFFEFEENYTFLVMHINITIISNKKILNQPP